MNQKQYINLCKKEYFQELTAIGVLVILTKLWLPIMITFPIIMYDLAALAFNIGSFKACYQKKQEIKLSKIE